MKEEKKSARQFRRRNFLLFSIGVLLLLTLGATILNAIFNQIADLNRKVLIDIAYEKALSVQKEFDLFAERIGWLEQTMQADKTVPIEALLAKDAILRSFLVVQPAPSASHPHDWKADLTYPLHDSAASGRDVTLAIDLRKLHAYLSGGTASHAYVEVVSADGFYLLHPEIAKLGTPDTLKAAHSKPVRDTIVVSNYLQTDILRRTSAARGLFAGAELAACVPLLITGDETQNIINLSMLLGIGLLIITITFLQIIYRNRLRVQQLELDHSKISQEQATMRFERLREQMNPHFLFNALGSLQQLISKDPSHAKLFVNKMAKVYRKILQEDRLTWTTIAEELSLAQSYFFLQEVRFGQALLPIRLAIPAAYLQRQIPRLTLQLLVENAIKHTAFTAEHPLEIHMAVEQDRLVITNPYRPRSVSDSDRGGYGLTYISSFYRYFEQDGFDYGIEANVFAVRLPLH